MSISKSLLWKFLERFSVQGTQFLIQIILARLLSPKHYGALAIMMIFVNLANVIIQNGFNTALIQNKDADEEDFSSVFWLLLGISTLVYIILYMSAPWLATYYDMPYLEKPFKVICLMLIPGALNSVQLAIIRRKMDFKKEFTSNVVSIVIAGLVGIICAYVGLGLWSLVIQTLVNTTVACITMWHVVGWRPKYIYNHQRVMKLFNFGYKLVLAGLLDTLSNNLSSLIIGARHNATALGYFSRGAQFPGALMGAVNSTVQSVMLPVMASVQNDKQKAKSLMRKAIVLSCYLVFPMMAVFAGIAKPLVEILLTEKWLECVAFIQIFCFIYAFWPIHSCNLQAINAMGRSDIFLKLEIIKKLITWINLSFSVFYFDTPIAIAGIGILSTILCSFVNCYPNKVLLDYSFKEQIKDTLSYFILSLTMFILLNFISDILEATILNLMLLILLGVSYYWVLSYLLKLEAYIILWEKVRQYLCPKHEFIRR